MKILQCVRKIIKNRIVEEQIFMQLLITKQLINNKLLEMSNFQYGIGTGPKLQAGQTPYSQTLKNIYCNPYRLDNHSMLAVTNSQLYNLHRSYIPVRNTHRQLSSRILYDNDQYGQQQVNTSCDLGQATHYSIEKKFNGLGDARLAASAIFQNEDLQQKRAGQQKIQQKPQISYYVSQFIQLQQENKRLQRKIHQYQTKAQNSQQTDCTNKSVQSQLDLLYENQQLRKKLAIQIKRNQQKDLKINELVCKISRVEKQIQYIVKNSKIVLQSYDQQSQATQSQPSIVLPTCQCQQKYENRIQSEKEQLSIQVEQIKIYYSSIINESVNKLLQKISDLETQVNESKDLYAKLEDKVGNIRKLVERSDIRCVTDGNGTENRQAN